MIDLTGRVVLVPGANGGIGSHVARLFAECGADVALAYRAGSGEANAALDHARSLGRRARLDRLDATQPDAVRSWVVDVIRDWGRIDVLASAVPGASMTISTTSSRSPSSSTGRSNGAPSRNGSPG